MEEEGIVFTCNANVGVNILITDLLREYDAIILAGGSTIPRDLNIKGRAIKGVHFAMDFLTQQNKLVANLSSTLSQGEREANGQRNLKETAYQKNVVVIGGGDTGSDCVGTSNRQKAKTITQFELMPTPPKNRTANMPWPQYPMILKNTSSHDEGATMQWATATKEFVADEIGNLKALKIVDLQWKITEDGKPANFVEIENTEREIPCEMALLAMGFVHPQQEGLLNQLQIELDEKGNVKATEKDFQTNISKIFTAGDMRRGQSLVVWAISEGRECARKVDEFLIGSTMLESKDYTIQNIKY